MEGLQKLLNDFGSWYWWVSVVVVSFVVNLGSSYAKEPLDRWFSQRSASTAEKIAARQRRHETLIRLMMEDARLITLTANRFIWVQMMSMLMMVLAIAMMVISTGARSDTDIPESHDLLKTLRLLTAVGAVFAIGASIWAMNSARLIRLALDEVRRRIAADARKRIANAPKVDAAPSDA